MGDGGVVRVGWTHSSFNKTDQRSEGGIDKGMGRLPQRIKKLTQQSTKIRCFFIVSFLLLDQQIVSAVKTTLPHTNSREFNKINQYHIFLTEFQIEVKQGTAQNKKRCIFIEFLVAPILTKMKT